MNSLFISCVSNEFGNYRDALRKDFARPNLESRIQEDFAAFAGSTLEKLDEYIKGCDAVIHFCGEMTGSMAHAYSIEFIQRKYPDFGQRIPQLLPVLRGEAALSYTQWEAFLAIYHGKRLFIVKPAAGIALSEKFEDNPQQKELQINHLGFLNLLGHYAQIEFTTQDELAKKLYQSNLGDILYSIPGLKPINLPYLSIGENFKGREDFIQNDLRPAFEKIKPGINAIALHGLGGVGKTRLAVEYALQYQNDYTGLLFMNADQPAAFQSHMAGLTKVLDLKEKDAEEEGVKYGAVVNWLNTCKGWLMILDNVDSIESAERVEDFLAELQHGQVFITTRISQWSGAVETIPLGTLGKEASGAFLLETTEKGRAKMANDVEMATRLAADLGYLALALEQARAYIGKMEISLEAYHKTWLNKRQELMKWFDGRLMQYDRSVATTWKTSFDQLSPAAQSLMNRLAWFAPDPIPKTILDAEGEGLNPTEALSAWSEFKQFSLVTSNPDKTTFSVHRLVQEVTRHWMDEQTAENSLKEALNWIDAAFVGDPEDVRDWSVLGPLAPHVQKITETAKIRGIGEPTSFLINKLGVFYFSKGSYYSAETLMRDAVAFAEANNGESHHDLASRLNNLALLLNETERHSEAEDLLRRAIKLDKVSNGAMNPDLARDLNSLVLVLLATDRNSEAIPLMRRALRIDMANFEPNHANVARDLNQLAKLLKDSKRLTEAERLMRKALKINKAYYGEDNPNVARALNNLARLLQDTKRLPEAEQLMRRALNILGVSLGFEHPNTQTVLNNYKILLEEMGKTEAEIELIIKGLLGQ